MWQIAMHKISLKLQKIKLNFLKSADKAEKSK